MSDGLNKAFKNTKQAFLRLAPISVMGLLAAGRELTWKHKGRTWHRTIEVPDTGRHDFNLEYASQFNATISPKMEGGYVHVVPREVRTGVGGIFSHSVNAYFLRWASRKTTSMVLGNDADYFFTSQLNGCQVRVAPTSDGSGTKVLHIAGDGPSAAARLNPWRDEQARSVLSEWENARSRRFSSTDPVDGYHDAFWANVFGFRRGRNDWEMWTQIVDYSMADDRYVVRAVTQLYPAPPAPEPRVIQVRPAPQRAEAPSQAPRATPSVAVSEAPAVLRRFAIGDFASAEFTKVRKDAQNELGIMGPFYNVTTTFLPEDMFTPLEERLSFSVYFGATAWIIGEVFRKADQAAFYLDEAVFAQFAMAQKKRDALRAEDVDSLGVKNVIEPKTREFLGTIEGGAMSKDTFAAFLRDTPFGKVVTRIATRLAKRPVSATYDAEYTHVLVALDLATPSV
jgi:hypothetical protein